MVCDLSSFDSVRTFVREFAETGLRLHLLVLSAALSPRPGWGETEQGFEQHFGVNYVGHWLLTTELLPHLRAAAPARIVALSSVEHWDAAWNRRRVPPRKDAFDRDGGAAWAVRFSKLCLNMMCVELNRRLAGSGVSSYAAHPVCAPLPVATWAALTQRNCSGRCGDSHRHAQQGGGDAHAEQSAYKDGRTGGSDTVVVRTARRRD